jgi:hypothetical protein
MLYGVALAAKILTPGKSIEMLTREKYGLQLPQPYMGFYFRALSVH